MENRLTKKRGGKRVGGSNLAREAGGEAKCRRKGGERRGEEGRFGWRRRGERIMEEGERLERRR